MDIENLNFSNDLFYHYISQTIIIGYIKFSISRVIKTYSSDTNLKTVTNNHSSSYSKRNKRQLILSDVCETVRVWTYAQTQIFPNILLINKEINNNDQSTEKYWERLFSHITFSKRQIVYTYICIYIYTYIFWPPVETNETCLINKITWLCYRHPPWPISEWTAASWEGYCGIIIGR